ncbi:MAG: hypothetical protein WDO13_05945 [Verrucomicrobiota bacterium]
MVALPMVQGVVGGVVGGVASMLAPSAPEAPAPAVPSSFATALQRVTSAASSGPGTMQAGEWSQMSPDSVQTWARSLTGRHVDATDATGKSISGVVQGFTPSGNTVALNISGHVVPLSQLKQVTWSAATV